MKIIAGISNAHSNEEIEAYVNAGVDEFFIGYVPKEWSDVYGWEVSCNRREHSNYHYHQRDQFEEVVNMIRARGKKVFLTLNAHEYNQKQLDLLLKILQNISDIPVDSFIVSNLALMLKMRKTGIETPINISIGSGCNTWESILFYTENIENIGRIILPRKVTIQEAEAIANKAKEKNIKLEVFGMSDPCHFNDEYCFTWHGSMQPSLCQSPLYLHKKLNPIVTNSNWKKELAENNIVEYAKRQRDILHKIEEMQKKYNLRYPHYTEKRADSLENFELVNLIGKCGICAFNKFKAMGIDAVKLPLRGHHMKGNLMLVKLARTVLEKNNATPDFCKNLLKSPMYCNGLNCYYNYPYPK